MASGKGAGMHFWIWVVWLLGAQSGGQIRPKHKHNDQDQNNLEYHRLDQEFRALCVCVDVDLFHVLSFIQKALIARL